jgi:hypothetical protein
VPSRQVARHRSFGYEEAWFLNFAVDSRRAPRRVLGRRPFDQILHFRIDSRSTPTRSGAPAPVETKPGAVPADYRFWFHDDANIAPAVPEMPKRRPEESVQGMERWTRPFPFENRGLLAKREDLKSHVGPAAEEDTNHGEDGENAMSHEITLITRQVILVPRSAKTQITDFAANMNILCAIPNAIYMESSGKQKM